MFIYIRLFSQSERMICFTSLHDVHDVEVLQKHFSQPPELDFRMGVKYIEMQGCFIELEESSQKWHSLSGGGEVCKNLPINWYCCPWAFFGRRYRVIISCEAWPRQEKEHVECNVETCADMCLRRNLGGLRFGVCFSNGFGMPFLFSERGGENRTLHSCHYFGPSIGGEQSIIVND